MKKKNIQLLVILIVFAACMISHQQNALAGENPSLQNDSVPYVTMPDVSPKLTTGDGNPLLDFMFTADPTAVEYKGRIYVYATNDQQQYETIGGYGKNSYEYIKSLVMMSTDDMTN
ncbi:MAG: beta-xylosidase, partial [Bacteroidales bacterium]|nr:beta-xylosidase [Bacteroidales bacterium]MDY5448291.1 beta-xylosidase [Prevotella sp.]